MSPVYPLDEGGVGPLKPRAPISDQLVWFSSSSSSSKKTASLKSGVVAPLVGAEFSRKKPI